VSLAARGKRDVRRRTPGRRLATRRRERVARPTPGSAPNAGDRTALQKHVDFFDTNHDGRITLADTYRGLRRLGLGSVSSAAFAGVINVALGSSTSGAPSLTVNATRIHARKHASDTGVYGKTGHFSLTRFRRLFARYDRDRDGALDGTELRKLIGANRTDLLGHLGSRAEFSLLLALAGEPRNGKKVLTRERLEHFYDGSLFYQLAEEVDRRGTEVAHHS
jgi:peroxygenase